MASIGGPFGAYGGGWLDSLLGYEDPNQYRGDLERSGNNAPSTYFADMYPNPNEQMLNLDNNIFANRYGTAANDSFQQRFGNLPIDNRTLANAPPNLFGPIPGQAAPGQPEGPLPPANAQYTSGSVPAQLTVNRGLTPPAPYATNADSGLPTGRTTIPAFGFNGPSAPPPPMEPGIGDRLSAAAHGLGKSGPLIPALVNMMLGGITGRRQDPEGISLQNMAQRQFAMFQALMQQPGMTPEMARAGALDPKIGQSILEQPTLIKEWRQSGSRLPFDKFVLSKEKPMEVNQGTYTSLVRPESVGAGGVTGGQGGIGQPGGPAVAGGIPAPPGTFPIDLAGKARQTALGTEQGQAGATVGSAKLQALNSIKQLDAALKHPGLEKSVGGFKGMMPDINFANDPEAMAFRTIHNQLKSQAFLQAYETLRGGGQISNAEGGKAEAALNRAQTTLDPKEYREALKEFRDIMIIGIQRLESKAGQTPSFGTNQVPLPSSREINMGNGITIRQRQQ